MLAEYKQKTNLFVGLGLALQIGGKLLLGGSLLGSPVVLLGGILFIIGCWNYALGKGYPGPVGLLGLLSCIGLLVLIVLPDRH